MFRVMLNGVLLDIKKRWGRILVESLFYIYTVCSVISVIYYCNDGRINDELVKQIMVCMSLCGCLFLYIVLKETPLRVCRGMFSCAAGKKEKMLYLTEQLMIKMIFGCVFMVLSVFCIAQKLFVHDQLIMRVAQLMLWFFTLYISNLRVGIGVKGNRKSNKEGYAIYSKAEVAVNEYWTCLIVIENVIFYTMVFMAERYNTMLLVGIWGGVMVLNIFLAIKYTKPVLNEALNYENVYHQEPIKPVEQYDICQNWAK